jgi:hypothetical protein
MLDQNDRFNRAERMLAQAEVCAHAKVLLRCTPPRNLDE